jgi:gluconolactonase
MFDRARASLRLLPIAFSLATPLLAGCGSDGDTETPSDTEVPAVGTVELFSELPANSEGLAMGVDEAGAPALYVGSKDQILRVDASGAYTEVAPVKAPLGMARTAGGDLVVCGKQEGADDAQPTLAVIHRVTPSGEASVLVSQGDAPFGLTNFVAVAPDGSLVFSDSKAGQVLRADADGSNVALVADAISYANGLAFSPDGAKLYVASWDTGTIYAIPRDTSGAYGAPEVFASDVANVDGLVALASGDLLLVTSGEGLVKRKADGSKEVIATGLGLPANGAFGAGAYGEEWLYVTNLLGNKLWRVYVGEKGATLPTP